MPLRPELIQTPLPDGRLEVYDPLLERFMVLSVKEVSSEACLAAALLLEDATAARLRAQVLAARRAALGAAGMLPREGWEAAAGEVIGSSLPSPAHAR